MIKTDPITKSKAFAIASVMGNKNLSKIIDESWSSPVGSTKNKRAKAILQSLHKANNNYQYVNDGKGGASAVPNPFANLFAPTPSPFNIPQNNSGVKFIKTIDSYIGNPQETDVKNIIAANPNEWGHAADAIDAKYGPGTATKYDSLLKQAYAKPTVEWSNPQADWLKQQGINGQNLVRTIDKYINPEPVMNVPGMSQAEEDVRNVASGLSSGVRGLGEATGKTMAGIVGAVPAALSVPAISAINLGGKIKGWLDPQRRQVKQLDPFSIVKIIYPGGKEETPTSQKGSLPPGVSAPGTPVGPTAPAGSPPDQIDEINKIISANPADGTVGGRNNVPNGKQWDAAAAAIDAKYGPGTATKYDALLKGAYAGAGAGMTGSSVTGGTTGGSTAPGGTTPGAGAGFTQTPYTPGPFPPQPFTSGTSLEADRNAAYAAGMGPEAFAMQEMQDRNILAKKLGMSPEAAKSLPQGMLSTQINELEDAVNSEFKIDDQLNNIEAKKKAGMTIEGDLTAYIRGKDEYLGKVDKLLDDTRTAMATMDTSNPDVKNNMNNYLNYLTILKGRQNQRYVDFLKTSVDEWDADMTNDTNRYNASLTAAEKKITRGTAVTTEVYNNVKDMLKDLYNSLGVMEDRQIKLNQANADLAATQMSTALDAIKLNEGKDTTKQLSETDRRKYYLPADTTEYQWDVVNQAIRAFQGRTDLDNAQKYQGVSDYLTQSGIGRPDEFQALLYENFYPQDEKGLAGLAAYEYYFKGIGKEADPGADWGKYLDSLLTDETIKAQMSWYDKLFASTEDIAAKREELKKSYLDQITKLKSAGRSNQQIYDELFKPS